MVNYRVTGYYLWVLLVTSTIGNYRVLLGYYLRVLGY